MVPAQTHCLSDLNGEDEVSPSLDRAGGEWGGGACWHSPLRHKACCGREYHFEKPKMQAGGAGSNLSALSVQAANPADPSIKESLRGICCPGAGEVAPVVMK